MFCCYGLPVPWIIGRRIHHPAGRIRDEWVFRFSGLFSLAFARQMLLFRRFLTHVHCARIDDIFSTQYAAARNKKLPTNIRFAVELSGHPMHDRGILDYAVFVQRGLFFFVFFSLRISGLHVTRTRQQTTTTTTTSRIKINPLTYSRNCVASIFLSDHHQPILR